MSKSTKDNWLVVPLMPIGALVMGGAKTDEPICQLEDDGLHQEEIERRANLIAASPELLESCRDALFAAQRVCRLAEDWLNQGQIHASISTEGTLAEMYASMNFAAKCAEAIAKAEGDVK